MHNARYCTYGQKSNSYSTGATPLIYDYIWYKAAKERWALVRESKIFLIHRSVSVEHFKVLLLKDKAGKSFSNHEAVEATVKLINWHWMQMNADKNQRAVNKYNLSLLYSWSKGNCQTDPLTEKKTLNKQCVTTFREFASSINGCEEIFFGKRKGNHQAQHSTEKSLNSNENLNKKLINWVGKLNWYDKCDWKWSMNANKNWGLWIKTIFQRFWVACNGVNSDQISDGLKFLFVLILKWKSVSDSVGPSG